MQLIQMLKLILQQEAINGLLITTNLGYENINSTSSL